MTKESENTPENMLETIEKLTQASGQPTLDQGLDQLQDITKQLYSVFAGMGSNMKSSIEEKEAQYRQIVQQNKQIEQQNTEMAAVLQETAQSLQKALEKIIKTHGTVHVVEEASTDNEGDNQAYVEQISELTETRERLQAMNDQLEEERQTLQENLESVEKELLKQANWIQENEHIKTTNVQLEEEKQNLQKNLTRALKEFNELKEQMRKNDTAYKVKLDKLISVYEESADNSGYQPNEEAQAKIIRYEDEIRELTSKNQGLNTLVDKQINEKKLFKSEIAQMEKEYEKQLAALKGENSTLKEKLADAQLDLKNLQKQTSRKPLVEARRTNLDGITVLSKDNKVF